MKTRLFLGVTMMLISNITSTNVFSIQPVYQEDFEGERILLLQKMPYWVTTQKCEVKLHELSKTEFHSGKQSEHIIVKYLGSGERPCDFWGVGPAGKISIPLIPGAMTKISAWVKSTQKVALICSVSYEGTHTPGLLSGSISSGSGQWEELTISNIVDAAEKTAKAYGFGTDKLSGKKPILNMIGFNLYISPDEFTKSFKADVYIDNITVYPDYAEVLSKIDEIEKEREKVLNLLSETKHSGLRKEFEEIYKKIGSLKETLKQLPQGNEEYIKGIKEVRSIIIDYEELKRKLTTIYH